MSHSGPDDTGSNAPVDRRDGGSGPTPVSDDTCFMVLDPVHLHELVSVLSPAENNALFFVREGVGIRARTRSEHCYLIEGTVPPEAFDVFRTEDADLFVDVDSLGRALDRTGADRVAVRGKPDGSVVLDDGRRTFSVDADDVPLESNSRNDPSWFEREMLIDVVGRLEFTAPATGLKGLVGADRTHDHAGITVERDTRTAEVFFFDAEGDDRTVSVRLGPDDLVSPPELPDTDIEEPPIVTAPLCREAIDRALSPARGPVTVTVSEHADSVPIYIEYERADGLLSVTGELMYKEGAHETLERLDQTA